MGASLRTRRARAGRLVGLAALLRGAEQGAGEAGEVAGEPVLERGQLLAHLAEPPLGLLDLGERGEHAGPALGVLRQLGRERLLGGDLRAEELRIGERLEPPAQRLVRVLHVEEVLGRDPLLLLAEELEARDEPP
jgi:hypothetical protein